MKRAKLHSVLLAILLIGSSANAFFFFMVIPANAPKQFVRIYLRTGGAVRDTLSYSTITLNNRDIQYLKAKNTKVFPDETDSIIVNGYVGIPVGTSWLFKAVEGQLTLFTNDPFSSLERNIVALQLGNGPIIPYSLDTLKEYVKQEKRPSRYLKKRIVNGMEIKPDPIKAAYEFNTKHFQTISRRDSLVKVYKTFKKRDIESRISLLYEIFSIDSSYDKAYWDLAEIFASIDTAKACQFYYVADLINLTAQSHAI